MHEILKVIAIYIYIAREILLGYGFVREINEGFRNVNSVMLSLIHI